MLNPFLFWEHPYPNLWVIGLNGNSMMGGEMSENQFSNPYVTVISSGDIGKIVEKADEYNSIVEFHDSPTDRFQLAISNSDLKVYRPELNGLVWLAEPINSDSHDESLVTYLRGTWLLERDNGQWGITIRRSGERGDENVLISPNQVLIHRKGSLFKPVSSKRAIDYVVEVFCNPKQPITRVVQTDPSSQRI